MYKFHEIEINDKRYPQELSKIKNAPNKLYVMGNNIELLNNKCLAMVGTRNLTEYGEFYASKFAREISKYGITIISGLAIRNRYSSS